MFSPFLDIKMILLQFWNIVILPLICEKLPTDGVTDGEFAEKYFRQAKRHRISSPEPKETLSKPAEKGKIFALSVDF
jgi:hypothetical protein